MLRTSPLLLVLAAATPPVMTSAFGSTARIAAAASTNILA